MRDPRSVCVCIEIVVQVVPEKDVSVLVQFLPLFDDGEAVSV